MRGSWDKLSPLARVQTNWEEVGDGDHVHHEDIDIDGVTDDDGVIIG